ncbi:serine hydrolase domain-containing protein [Rufibacter tibetensis]|uniref:serine hydrolase domain-containing protein n=1 Tax=Rufibacter tibetensis TaxID=512763 RepID=UPI0007864603|nr:serine hydrolase domain-containing protein [Rufibacter tibetensis]
MKTYSKTASFPEQPPMKERLLRGISLFLLLGLLAWVGCTPKARLNQNGPLLSGGKTQVPTLDASRISILADSLAQVYLKAGEIPGISMAVAKEGEVVFSKGYGEANLELGMPACSHTVYKIRSVTKQFTAALVMRLVEAGKISLDDSITRFLPDYPTQGHHITIRNLLNHTSGISNQSSSLTLQTALNGGNKQWFKLDLSLEEMIDRFGKLPFNFKPGQQFQYNNLGYYLLGHIIQKITGMPYAAYLEQELLQPLELGETLFADDHRIILNRAAGYEFYGGKLMNAPYTSPQAGFAAGAIGSTVGDLVKWTHLLHSGKVVSKESLQQMTSPTVLSNGDTVGYGFGLYLAELGSHRKVYHGGTRPGFGAYLAHYPEAGVTIAILTNSGSGREKAAEMEKVLARSALNEKVLNLPLAQQDLEPYTGTYTFQSTPTKSRELRVFYENGQLKGQMTGGKPFRLLYQGQHVFIPEVNDTMRLIFSMENGRVDRLKIKEGPWEVTPATRKS